jgi:16S rRNA (cytidine1402-2'-O)-methyltransferase
LAVADTEKKKKHQHGKLYVVATPIGNMEDITLRALRTLKEVDLIAAENVAHTRKLCRHYDIKTRLTSYNQHNQKRKTPELLGHITSGENVAMVSDAGTPGISDPGISVIQRSHELGIDVVPIPGPSAVIAALSVSGLISKRFLFVGFLSNKQGKRKKALEELKQEQGALIFYEAPHRVKAMLMDLLTVFGNRKMVLLREMTKLFEEVHKGSVKSITEELNPDNTRGEFTLVVEGRMKAQDQELHPDVLHRIENLIQKGDHSAKDIAKELAEEKGLAYRKVYKACLARIRASG